MKPRTFASLLSQPAKPLIVTVFGAESTGKTTLSQHLAAAYGATWLYEFARPYLELTHFPITRQSMMAIWHGQHVIQTMATGQLVIQDTDLYSTIGYWQFPHWKKTLRACPSPLIKDASSERSDLYIITPSTIPFESDPLRYGNDHREGSDDYWIDVCKQYSLPYAILSTQSRHNRLTEASILINHHLKRSTLCVES